MAMKSSGTALRYHAALSAEPAKSARKRPTAKSYDLPIGGPALMVVGPSKVRIESYQQASTMFEAARDEAMRRGLTPSDVPSPLILDSVGHILGYVSWNGRVWPGMPRDPFDAARKPLYDNRIQPAVECR